MIHILNIKRPRFMLSNILQVQMNHKVDIEMLGNERINKIVDENSIVSVTFSITQDNLIQ